MKMIMMTFNNNFKEEDYLRYRIVKHWISKRKRNKT